MYKTDYKSEQFTSFDAVRTNLSRTDPRSPIF